MAVRLRPSRLALALLLLAVPKSACMPGNEPGELAEPSLWPDRAYLGETIAMPITTNNLPGFPFFEPLEQHDATTSNVQLRIKDADGIDVDFTPRAVLTGAPGAATEVGPTGGGATVTFALLDLPETTYPSANFDFSSYPVDRQVTIIYDGVAGAAATLSILGPETDTRAKGPKFFQDFATGLPLDQALTPRPVLRLRAHGPTSCSSPKLPLPSGTIGGMEFEIEYPSVVSNPDPIPTAEAGRATATATVIATGRARVLLLDPDGFQLPDATGCSSGTGPFLDIAFTKSDEFAAGDFTIRNLYVTDVDGVPIVDDRGSGSTEYFDLIVRNNL